MRPEAFETPQGLIDRFHRLALNWSIGQLFDMPVIQRGHRLADRPPLFGNLDPDGASIMGRAFLQKIIVLNHFLDVIADIGPLVITTVCQFADRQLFVANMGQNEALNVIDIFNTQPIEFGFHDFKKLAMKSLDEKN